MRNKNILIMVVFASIMGHASTDIYLPAVPNLVELFEVSDSWLKTSVSIFFLGYAVSQLISGPMSDIYGRRLFMLLGVLAFGFGSFLALISNNIYSLIIARITQGIGAGLFGVSNRAILFDTYKGVNYTKSIAIVGMIMAASPMVSPSIGGIINEYLGWRFVFAIMLFYAIILKLFLYLFLPETIKNKSKPISDKFYLNIYFFYKVIFDKKYFWQYSLINTIGFSAFIFYIISSVFIIQNQLGYSPIEYGRIICLLSVGYILGGYTNNYLSSKYYDKYSREDLISIGNIFQISSFLIYLILCYLALNKLLCLIIPMMFFVFGTGIINPNATSLLVSKFPERAATAAAAMGFIMTLGTSVISITMFLLHIDSIQVILTTILIFAVLIRLLSTIPQEQSVYTNIRANNTVATKT